MPQTYIDIRNGYANMVIVKRMPQVKAYAYWHCAICNNTGGDLGFAGAVGVLNIRFCVDCDNGTKQVTIKA